MPEERKPVRRRSGAQSQSQRNQNNIKREPATRSGTIRDNLERYRSDSVSDAKARQSSSRDTGKTRKANQEAQKKQRRKKLIIRLAVTLLVVIICVLCFLFTFRVFYDTPLDENNTEKVEITIPDAEITDEEVAELLQKAGCISDTKLYKLRTYIYDANYVPGTYKVSPSFSTEKIINILSGYDYSDGLMEEN